jgi:hypothetical protein
MGSGISLRKEQVIAIIKRSIKEEFDFAENLKPKYTADGVEIYYDFADEYNFKQKMKMLEDMLKYIEKNRY